jgi:hypothetical protein
MGESADHLAEQSCELVGRGAVEEVICVVEQGQDLGEGGGPCRLGGTHPQSQEDAPMLAGVVVGADCSCE